ncbi:MAG: amino acid ABC transporter substrate-binding protein [Rhizobiales bacterium]|nr:amino acid ABC transporter substrate-binding protein [Hyphomicrobiales bacterium]
MKFTRRVLLAAAAVVALAAPAAAANMIGNCEVYGEKGSIPIATPAKAGQFTVLTSLPAPIWWNGDAVENTKDGMEYCMAAEIAWRAGYDKMEVVNTSWEAFIGNQVQGYDVGFAQTSITEERKKVFDFTTPYFNSDMGVIAKADAPVDEKSVKTVKVGIQQGTTGAAFAQDTLGIKDAQIFADQPEMFAALRAGQIDAAITDTSITLAEEKATEGKSKVVGQYKTGEVYGGIMQKGNANNETVSKIIQSMIDDGTLAKLGAKYLAAGWGKDPATIPYFNP